MSEPASDRPPTAVADGMTGDLLDSVLDTLWEIRDADLVATEWPAVAGVVTALAFAVRNDDMVQLRALRDELDELLPTRTELVGGRNAEPPPRRTPVEDELRERIDVLVEEIKSEHRKRH
ncbi:MAG TPA: CATRA system-associated protein [Pseudonocardiaceae bacterium]|jgi:hypothetical protein